MTVQTGRTASNKEKCLIDKSELNPIIENVLINREDVEFYSS